MDIQIDNANQRQRRITKQPEGLTQKFCTQSPQKARKRNSTACRQIVSQHVNEANDNIERRKARAISAVQAFVSNIIRPHIQERNIQERNNDHLMLYLEIRE